MPRPFAAGLDLAWKGADEAVLPIIDIPTNFVCHLEIFPKTSNQDLYDIVTRSDRQWNQPVFHFDRTGGKATAWAEHIPSHIRSKPLVLRRSVDRNRQFDYVVSKDLLVRSFEQRFTLGKVQFPHEEDYPFEKLPWSSEQDQRKNFAQLYRQMLGMRRITIKKADGNEEYIYRAEATLDRNHKYRAADDCFDGLVITARGLPALQEAHISLEEFEREMASNW
jgi:hypothetical protein